MGSASALGRRDIRGMFFKRLEEVAEASWVSRIAFMAGSDQDRETYKFLGQIPAMRSWVGRRNVVEPNDYEIQIVNDVFENSIEFGVDDLRRDKTAQIQARIGDLAARAATLPQRTLTTLLAGNANAYDGVSFFGNHVAAFVINNALTDTGVVDAAVPTTAEMTAGILAMVESMLGVVDDQGEPVNEFARQFLLMVPTNYWSQTVASLRDQFTSSGVSNTLKSAMEAGTTIQPVVNPRMTAATGASGIFYLFRIDSDVKPLIWQDEKPTDFDGLDASSEHAFWNRTQVFGATRIGQGGLGMFEMANRMTFS